MNNTKNRFAGVLLGTALGDSLGLVTEGLSPRVIERRFGRVNRFHLLGQTGFVSDDTEQSALLAQSLLRAPTDPVATADSFRKALLGWFCRLPWGVGLATLRSCLRAAIGLRPSGVRSAGNGAAMRSAVLGVYFAHQPEKLVRFATATAEVTHTDPRAVDGAVFVAALAAACSRATSGADRAMLVTEAIGFVREPSLRDALAKAQRLAAESATAEAAALALGTTGFVMHTVPFATFCFLRFGDDPLGALSETISAGGDTDSIAAIVGAWVGALHGDDGLPRELVAKIHDGPFGPSHLRQLAAGLVELRDGKAVQAPRYSPMMAMLRNVALFPVILGHGLRRLIPL